jgi:hypothetical protein
MLKRLFLLTAAALLAACSSDPAGSTQGGLRAERVDGAAVGVTNTGDQPVYYVIVNPEALASWRPCTSPSDCPAIGGRQTVRIPYASIELYEAGSREAQLYWWKFARVQDGHVTVDEGRLRIRL